MQLVVTLRKDVADRDEGKALFDYVKTALARYPGVVVGGHVENHFEVEPSPEPPE